MKSLKLSLLLLLSCAHLNVHTILLQYVNPKGTLHHLSPTFLTALTQTLFIPNFIETGTFEGFTTEIALQFFSTVNTFELSPEHYYRACEKFELYAHVHPHWGDSGRILRTVLSKLTGNNLFWLDAHYSGCGTAFAGSGTPILEELKAIKSHGNQMNAIIMIDDIRLFDLIPRRESADAGQGFPDMTDIFEILMEINPNYSFALLGDTLMAFVPNSELQVSPVVHACTLSRLSKCLNISDDEVQALEVAILYAAAPEKSTFRDLYDVYCNPNSNTPSPYYHIWYGLTLMTDKQFEAAAQQFERAIALDFNPPRVQGYLQHAQAQYAQQLEKQKAIDTQSQTLQRLYKENAQYEQELTLYKQRLNTTVPEETDLTTEQQHESVLSANAMSNQFEIDTNAFEEA